MNPNVLVGRTDVFFPDNSVFQCPLIDANFNGRESDNYKNYFALLNAFSFFKRTRQVCTFESRNAIAFS